MMGGTSDTGGFARVTPTKGQGPAQGLKFEKICGIQILPKMHPKGAKKYVDHDF